jgi:serine/threonine-protein kinase
MRKNIPLELWQEQWRAEFLSRNYAGALGMARETPADDQRAFWEWGQKQLAIGRSLAALGDRPGAIQALEQGLVQVSKLLSAHPDSPELHQGAARIYAALGDKTNALSEAERAVTLSPLSRIPDWLEPLNTLAEVHATFGDAEEAISLLRQLAATEGTGLLITPDLLRLDPVWDPIRNDARFQKLVGDFATK